MEIRRTDSARSVAAAIWLLSVVGLISVSSACAARQDKPAAENTLHQTTGEAGSAVPKAHPPYYPNTAGNIVAPPGNPAGNPAGAPPIVGGTENRTGGWPEGR